MSGVSVPINFVVGSRRLFGASRRLQVVRFALADLLGDIPPRLPDADPSCQGYRVFSAPAAALEAMRGARPGYVLGGLDRFERFYIDMSGTFEDYLARFSSKTRATLRRKQRKLAEHCGGALDVREYRTAPDMQAFLAHAIPLSRRTYQGRLLGAGLPEGPEAEAEMTRLADAGRVRAYVLMIGDEPASYLYLPVEGRTLVYSHLGYDPAHAALSVGTVLQLEALERLYAEERFSHFDFTEGQGDHKRLFGTHSAQACSFFLLRPRLANRAVMSALDGFDWSVAGARRVAERSGLLSSVRRALRG